MQSGDKDGIRAQNRRRPRTLQHVTDLLTGDVLGIIMRLAVKKVQVSSAACTLAQDSQWEENPF